MYCWQNTNLSMFQTAGAVEIMELILFNRLCVMLSCFSMSRLPKVRSNAFLGDISSLYTLDSRSNPDYKTNFAKLPGISDFPLATSFMWYFCNSEV